MFGSTPAFSSFSVDDIAAARAFYGEVLGLPTGGEGESENEGGHERQVLILTLTGGAKVFVYPKGDRHVPASFTVLNFQVDDIDAAVDALVAKGVELRRYPGFDFDAKGICRDPRGPAIAWFTDPADNVLAVLQS
ncbi:VOC family protein [Streptomyces sp. NPDC046203]|uniref:VOC family protein n=1 Tax=Streptomyces sp. NPDC046203 TaxID=3154602 RepID=UPI0033C8D676